MRRNTQGRPIVLILVTATILAINLWGLWHCDCQIAALTAKVEAAEAALARRVVSDEAEDRIPSSNKPQGSLSGDSGWLAFYESLIPTTRTSLPVSIILFGISLLFVRERRSG